MELLILVFFALIGVFLLKIFMGAGSEEYMPPPPMYAGPPPQSYNPYNSEYSPYPPMQGYYASPRPPVRRKVPKQRVIIVSEGSKKRRTRKRKI